MSNGKPKVKGRIKVSPEDGKIIDGLSSKRKITFWNTWPPVMSERAAYIMNKYPGVLGKAIREVRTEQKKIS